MSQPRYVECDLCGERYWDSSIEDYMVELPSSGRMVCIVCKGKVQAYVYHARGRLCDWVEIPKERTAEELNTAGYGCIDCREPGTGEVLVEVDDEWLPLRWLQCQKHAEALALERLDI